MNDRQIWKRLLTIFGGMLLAWLLIALFLDPAPGDDSDLALPEREVDPAQNPYPEIREISLSEEEVKEIWQINSMVEGQEPFEETTVETLLERHAEALERFGRYATMRDWQQDLPLVAGADISFQLRWVRLAMLKRAESTWLASQGKREAAIESALSILKFAAGLRASEGPLLTTFMADSISTTGAKALADLLERCELTSDELAHLATKLDDPIFFRNDLETMLRTDYAFTVATSMDLATFNRVVRPILSKTSAWLPQSLGYKPNRTRSMLADYHRVAIRASNGDCRSFIAGTKAAIPSGWRTKWTNILTGNSLGFEMCEMYSVGNESYTKAPKRLFSTQAQHSLLRVCVAMKRYRLDRGDWPTTLNALVPAYLEAIPTDPMDGMPLRYNSERRIVYSVGIDFVDDGGLAPDKQGTFGDRTEIIIELDPASPEKEAASD
ncbi:MAG TPA: hypothetical protein PLA50_02535 [Bacteroidia bacterium]|nr:hypothetical protein [Bacteroidia bacterium]